VEAKAAEGSACVFSETVTKLEPPTSVQRSTYDQEEYYSGKKKLTIKNIVVIKELSEILWYSRTYGGRNHDKKIADEAPLEAFVGEMLADSGFQGIQKQCSKIKLPYKKPHKS
jgi:hypothetical protein